MLFNGSLIIVGHDLWLFADSFLRNTEHDIPLSLELSYCINMIADLIFIDIDGVRSNASKRSLKIFVWDEKYALKLI